MSLNTQPVDSWIKPNVLVESDFILTRIQLESSQFGFRISPCAWISSKGYNQNNCFKAIDEYANLPYFWGGTEYNPQKNLVEVLDDKNYYTKLHSSFFKVWDKIS